MTEALMYARWQGEYDALQEKLANDPMQRCVDLPTSGSCAKQGTGTPVPCQWDATCVQKKDYVAGIIKGILAAGATTALPRVPYDVLYVSVGNIQTIVEMEQTQEAFKVFPVYMQALLFLYFYTLQEECPAVNKSTFHHHREKDVQQLMTTLLDTTDPWHTKVQTVLAMCSKKCLRVRTCKSHSLCGGTRQKWPTSASSFMKRMLLAATMALVVAPVAGTSSGVTARDMLSSPYSPVIPSVAFKEPDDEQHRIVRAFEEDIPRVLSAVDSDLSRYQRDQWIQNPFDWAPEPLQSLLKARWSRVPDYILDFESRERDLGGAIVQLTFDYRLEEVIADYIGSPNRAGVSADVSTVHLGRLLVSRAPFDLINIPTRSSRDAFDENLRRLQKTLTVRDCSNLLPDYMETYRPYQSAYNTMKMVHEMDLKLDHSVDALRRHNQPTVRKAVTGAAYSLFIYMSLMLANTIYLGEWRRPRRPIREDA